MQKTLFRGFLMLFVSLVVVFSLTVGAESAEKTYKFSNGLSFRYPGEYEASGYDMGDSGSVVVGLMKMSDPYMRFSVAVLEVPTTGLDRDENFADWELARREELSKNMPSQSRPEELRQSKIKVAGRQAILTEGSEGDAFMRVVEVWFDNHIVVVNSMVLDKSRLNACRAIAEKIERSLKF